MKASKGMRISSTVPYGYKKVEGNKEQWYIDEPAAEIVRKIFSLCISGKGPSQIARQLEAEKVLTPTAYFNSVGTPTVVNKLIERIEIHNNEKKHSHNNVKVDIYFTAVGLFDIPTEQQLIDTMERVKQKNAEKSA